MTDTHHPRLTGEGQGGRRKFPRSCDTCCSPPQHPSSNHSISGPCSNNAPRIWGGGRALCGWTCRKYTYINTTIDVWLLCVKFLLRNKTIERALLKPGDHLFPFLALQHRGNPQGGHASREHRLVSGGGEKGGNVAPPGAPPRASHPPLGSRGPNPASFPPRVAAGEAEEGEPGAWPGKCRTSTGLPLNGAWHREAAKTHRCSLAKGIGWPGRAGACGSAGVLPPFPFLERRRGVPGCPAGREGPPASLHFPGARELKGGPRA